MNDQTESYGNRYSHLIAVLARCPAVVRLDRPGEPEASTLAHAFLDLEESFRRFIAEHLPALMDGNLTGDQVCDRLHDIGEDFRHILYHLQDSEYYRYLRS